MQGLLKRFVAPGFVLCLLCSEASAQEPRYVTENGVTYRETRQTVKQPAAQVEMRQQQQTVLEDHYTTNFHETRHTIYTPATQYSWQPRVHNWWNPFGPTQIAYHLTPTTTWVPATHIIRTPVTSRTVVPVTRTVQMPVRTLGFVERDQVRRVAVSPTPQAPARIATLQPSQTIARQTVYGGIERLDRTGPSISAGFLHGGVRRY